MVGYYEGHVGINNKIIPRSDQSDHSAASYADLQQVTLYKRQNIIMLNILTSDIWILIHGTLRNTYIGI